MKTALGFEFESFQGRLRYLSNTMPAYKRGYRHDLAAETVKLL